MKIPLFEPFIGKEEIAAAKKVIESKILSRGQEVKEFEDEFAKFVDKKYAIAVSSGTTGLQLAVRALGWKKGDEIITTPYSFIASSNALLYGGIIPKFVDIEENTLNIDPEKIEAAITDKTKGILLVHIWGLPADIKKLSEIKEKYNLQIIEDACEAIGRPNDRFPVSQIGELSVYGFYANKQMTSGGEGGMIVTDNASLADVCRSLRDQGRSSAKDWLNHVILGYNYRMTEIQAAIGRVQLKKIPFILNERKSIADRYNNLFLGIDDIKTPYVYKYNRSWFLYFIEFKNRTIRDKVASCLKTNGVETHEYFTPIYKYGFYRGFGYDQADFPNCETVSEKILALPLFIGLMDSEMKYIINLIKESL